MKYKNLNNEELIEVIHKLEGDIYELNSDMNKLKIKNNKLELLVSDILDSTNQILSENKENKRFKENKINFEELISNLLVYIKKYCKDNNLYIK